MVVLVRAVEFVLADEERGRLESWSRQSSRLGVRARIVLACAEPGVVYAHLAREVGVSLMTVSNVRRRFAAERVEGLAWAAARPRHKQEHPASRAAAELESAVTFGVPRCQPDHAGLETFGKATLELARSL